MDYRPRISPLTARVILDRIEGVIKRDYRNFKQRLPPKIYKNPAPLKAHLIEVVRTGPTGPQEAGRWLTIYHAVTHVNINLIGVSPKSAALLTKTGLVTFEAYKYVYLTDEGYTLWPQIVAYYEANAALEDLLELLT